MTAQNFSHDGIIKMSQEHRKSRFNKHLKLAFSLVSLAYAGMAFANEPNKIVCGTNTFNYNEASITKVDQAYELVIGGYELKGQNLRSIDGLRFELGTQPQYIVVAAKVPLEKCDVSEDDLTAKCSVPLSEVEGSNAYINWIQSDITFGFPATSPIVPARVPGTKNQRLDFVIGKGSAVLTLSGLNEGSTKIEQTTVNIPTCHNASESIIEDRFPQRLRDYLSRKSK
jgi:hypothetical protein